MLLQQYVGENIMAFRERTRTVFPGPDDAVTLMKPSGQQLPAIPFQFFASTMDILEQTLTAMVQEVVVPLQGEIAELRKWQTEVQAREREMFPPVPPQEFPPHHVGDTKLPE